MKKKRDLLTGESLIEFCRQMAMALKAGCSLEEGLHLLAEDVSGLQGLVEEVRATGDLAAALDHAGDCPPYFLRMIRLGQETGRLEDVMQALAGHYQRELELRRSLRDALSYPALMLAMVVVILGLLLSRVMPLFEQAFAQLGAGLTGLSRLLLELGMGLREWGWLAALLAVLAIGAAAVLQRRYGLVFRALGKLPFFRGITEKIALSRLTGALALGLGSGLSTHYALELAMELNTHKALAEKLLQARALLDRGDDLAEVLRRTGILSGSRGRLALVGRRTGGLDTALSQISRDCQEEADRTIDSAIAAIEPVMVAVLSVLVAVLLLSVLVPMLGLMSAI